MDAPPTGPRPPSAGKATAPRLALAGGLLAGLGYGLLAVANLEIWNLLRSTSPGDLAGAYLTAAAGDVLVGVGLALGIVGLAALLRR